MPSINQLAVGGTVFAATKEFTPTDLGLSSVNLKSVAASSSGLLNLTGYKRFQITQISVTVGAATVAPINRLLFDLYADDGTTILAADTILAINTGVTTATTTKHNLWFSVDRVLSAVDTKASGGSVSTTGENASGLRCVGYVKFKCDVTTASDSATSATASFYLRAQT